MLPNSERPPSKLRKILAYLTRATRTVDRCGEARKHVEFGHMIQLRQIEGKFVTGYNVFSKRPIE